MSYFVVSTTWLVASLVVCACNAARVPVSATFEEYGDLLGRQYDASEHALRRSIFETRAEAVRLHNARDDRIWTAGLNHLSDRTEAELKHLRGWRRSGDGSDGGTRGAASLLSAQVWRNKVPAESVDWRNLTVSSLVQDQGECGSCWAVAAAHTLQAHREINLKVGKPLSIQQLVNCVPNPQQCGGQGGCKGATVELAMKWVMANGLAEASDVPYEASDGACNAPALLAEEGRFLGAIKRHGGGSSHNSAAKLGFAGWNTLPSNRARPLMSALMNGPVAVSVGAGGWFLYDSGVFDGCDKDTVIDHAVVLVGYGSDKKSGRSSWTIRNSWGEEWGENGHIQLLRHNTAAEDDAYCGTDNKPEDGVECLPYPERVTVCGMCGLLYDSVAVHFDPAAAAR